jgi:hypothetical protein
MAECAYVWFRKTAGHPAWAAGLIVANFYRGEEEFDADLHGPTEDANFPPTDYGVLEVTVGEHNAMDTYSQANPGGYGKHVDDPTGVPTLAEGTQP